MKNNLDILDKYRPQKRLIRITFPWWLIGLLILFFWMRGEFSEIKRDIQTIKAVVLEKEFPIGEK